MAGKEQVEGLTEPVVCAQCKASVAWPADASPELLAQAAVAWRTIGLPAIYRNQKVLKIDHGHAKGLTFHITRKKGECHRCKANVADGVSTCANCGALNLDW